MTASSRIGGTTPAARNVISGNNSSGVGGGDFGRFNQVLGNFIGTDITGTQDLGNGGTGVSLFGGNRDGSGTVIGGTTAGARNIISGNNVIGVFLARESGLFIQGNYIGTDVTGTVAIANGAEGIALFESGDITIGGIDGPWRAQRHFRQPGARHQRRQRRWGKAPRRPW